MERTSAYEGGKSTGDHQLKLSQVVRCTDPLRYVYTENASKSQPGSLAQMRVKNKPILAVPESGTRCHVDLYMKKLPAEAFSRDKFYVQPRPRVPDDPTKPWFSANPTGKNSLSEGSITVKTKMLL